MVVRTVPDGDSKDEEGKQKMKEVWMPVTIRLESDPATLSVFGRVAEPVERARWGMEGVMVGERGEDGYLALRLPMERKEITI